jgi:hypothetical protein
MDKRSAYGFWKKTGNEWIQNHLRDELKIGKGQKWVVEKMLGAISEIDADMNSRPAFNEGKLLYRGISANTMADELKGLKVGDVFHEPGYSATAENKRQAEVFAEADMSIAKEYRGALLEITLGPGIHGIDFQAEGYEPYYPEKETLLQRDLVFEVTGIVKGGTWGEVVDKIQVTAYPLPTPKVAKSLKHGDHDQSEHGNWATGGGDGSKENPIRTNSVEDAARALGEGKHVELRTPDQVATLLDRLNDLAKEAEAAGTKAKNIDLCQLTVPGTNLFCVESKGIPRVEMPQLKGIPNSGSAASDLPADKRGEVDITEAYLERLRSSGISLTGDEALASHLKATQNELNGGKVAGIMQAARAGGLDLNQPIVVSKDGYIVDGHHRWAAKVALEHDGIDDPETDMKIPVVRVDQDILEILESSKQFAADMGLPQMAVKSFKHADHDQADHGSWATGGGGRRVSETQRKEAIERGSATTLGLSGDRNAVQRALRAYTAAKLSDDDDNRPVHEVLNGLLRDGRPLSEALDALDPEDKAAFKELDRQFQPSDKGWKEVPSVLVQDTMLYRGMPGMMDSDQVMDLEAGRPVDFGFGILEPGDRISDRGYGSTSLEVRHATYFAERPVLTQDEWTDDSPEQVPVIWKISAPEGTPALSVDHSIGEGQVYGEAEIILGRNTTYEITNVSYSNRGVIVEAKIVQ